MTLVKRAKRNPIESYQTKGGTRYRMVSIVPQELREKLGQTKVTRKLLATNEQDALEEARAMQLKVDDSYAEMLGATSVRVILNLDKVTMTHSELAALQEHLARAAEEFGAKVASTDVQRRLK